MTNNMYNLQDDLKNIQNEHISSEVWSAVQATQFVLNEFYNAVRNKQLQSRVGKNFAYYYFDYSQLKKPADATYDVKSWLQYEDFVIRVIQEVTRMKVIIFGNEIQLSVPTNDQQQNTKYCNNLCKKNDTYCKNIFPAVNVPSCKESECNIRVLRQN